MATKLGRANVYLLEDGTLAVRQKSTRRSRRGSSRSSSRRQNRRLRRQYKFQGDDLGYEDTEMGDESYDFGDEFEGDDFEGDDFEGDDFEGDDFEGDDDLGDDELGDAESRLARLERRWARRGKSHTPRHNRRRNRLQRRIRKQQGSDGMGWGKTIVSGTDTLGAAGDATVRIRLQHQFKAEDIFFNGSANGATVKSIFFGDKLVWSNPDGVDVSAFSTSGFLRGLLKGQNLSAGLDIIVTGTLGGAGDLKVGILGYKPNSAVC